jgi:hypothetical protein
MAAAETKLHESTEVERIERWRAEALERAGYEPRVAKEIAARLDLHLATDLLARGCPQDVAARILL